MRKSIIICMCILLCSYAVACNDKDTVHSSNVDTENTIKNITENITENTTDNIMTVAEDISESTDSYILPATSKTDVSISDNGYSDGENIAFNNEWQYADNAVMTSGSAVMYKSNANRKNIIIAVNAGHGTAGGTTVKTLCHPDGSAKTTGGTTAKGATMAVAVSSGMTFNDGVVESRVTLRMAEILRDALLQEGYDVLMLRDSDDVQLDNVARTVMANNIADCHIALHWDGDGLSYDKGCFYIAVPDAIKDMEPVASHWQDHNTLGDALIDGLSDNGAKINGRGSMQIDLTQTSYSTIPSVDIELGNACSDHSDSKLETLSDGLVQGINYYYN